MKVYESSHITKDGFTTVPQIRIKNKKLCKYDLNIGTEFKIIYQDCKIIIEIVNTEKK